MRSGAKMEQGGPALGFTVTELMVSFVLFGIVMASALSFLHGQNRGFLKGLDYVASNQTLRFAMGTLERDIQTAGTNLLGGQPAVVYVGENVMAFNSDYATRTEADFSAVFFHPHLEAGAARAWSASQRENIPRSSFVYPDTTYADDAGRPGAAETLIFFFEEDRETDRRDDFALYRKVNAEEPQLVARHLLQVPGQPFFRYLTESDSGIDSIPPSWLPLAHAVLVPGSAADTGRAALVDRIRGVRITLAATNGQAAEAERISQVTRIVRMPNMGLERLTVCGSEPVLAPALSVSLNVSGTNRPVVDLTWEPSSDDGQGEDDIVRYVIWRRVAGSVDWKDPFLSIPAGKSRYIYRDADLAVGETYQYAMAAQDCTPALSSLSVSSPVTIHVP